VIPVAIPCKSARLYKTKPTSQCFSGGLQYSLPSNSF
jgi:hypothetical protein